MLGILNNIGKYFYLSSRNIKENQNPRILKGILLITFISDALIHLQLAAQSLKSSNLDSDYLFLAQLVKNLPAMQETPLRFLSQEDPLEKG